MLIPNIIKIAAVPVENVFNINTTSQGTTVTGFDGRLLINLAEKLNFQYQILVPSDGQWGSQDNSGNWTGVINMLLRGEADMGMNTMAITEERYHVVDFSVPYFLFDRTFVTAAPGYMAKFTAFTYPFSMTVWVLAIFTTLMTTFILQKELSTVNFLLTFLTMTGSVFNQPLNMTSHWLGKKIFYAFWLAFARFMPFFYSACLLSFLTLPQKQVGLRNFMDLSKAVDSKTYKCLVPKGTADGELLLHSRLAYVQRLGQTILDNNWKFDVNMDNSGIESLIDKSTAVFGSRQGMKIKLGDPRISSKFISEDSLGTWNVGIALRKDFCCKRKLNSIIRRFISGGLIEKWFEDEVFVNNIGRHLKMSPEEVESSLTIDDLSGVFYLLLLGHSLAILVFFFECMCKRRI